MSKNTLKTTICLGLLVLVPQIVLALRPTEVTYPDITDLTITPQTVRDPLPEYLMYIFTLFIAIAGFICLGVLVYAGVMFITSTGRPTQQKKARQKILQAVFGIIIVLSSYLISKTINPQLVTPHVGIEPVGGVIAYIERADCTGEHVILSGSVSDMEEQYDGPIYSLTFAKGTENLEVVTYQDKNYERGALPPITPDSSATLMTEDGKKCFWVNTPRSEPAESIKFIWRLPGIYLCRVDPDQAGSDGTYDRRDPVTQHYYCNGIEKNLPADTALLPADFNNKVRGIKIVNDIGMVPRPFSPAADAICYDNYGGTIQGEYCVWVDQRYGVILHEMANWSGRADIIFADENASETVINLESQTVNLSSSNVNDNFTYNSNSEGLEDFVTNGNISSLTLFIEREDLSELPGGVYLCDTENPLRPSGGDNPSGCIGQFPTTPQNITNRRMEVEDIRDVGVNRPNRQQGITSLFVDGSYLLVLFDDTNFEGKSQTFDRNDSNLRNDPLGQCGCFLGSNWRCKDCTESFIVIPTKGETGAEGPTVGDVIPSAGEIPEGESCSDYAEGAVVCNTVTDDPTDYFICRDEGGGLVWVSDSCSTGHCCDDPTWCLYISEDEPCVSTSPMP